MGYFVLGWYPIRSQDDISENILSALIIEVLCLMPILDLLMWKSMNLCAENIINNRSKNTGCQTPGTKTPGTKL